MNKLLVSIVLLTIFVALVIPHCDNKENVATTITVREINSSPADYCTRGSLILPADKQEHVYRFAFRGSGIYFESEKYLKVHPQDAVMKMHEENESWVLIVLSDKEPDPEFFRWSS